MGAENKRRKKWLRRTAAVLAAVLVLAELPVQVTFASQTEPVTEESISSVNIEKAEPEGESQTESGSESETESEAGSEPETVLESGTEPEGSQAEETSEEESTIEEITEEETTEEATTEEETTTEEVTTEEETVSEEEEQLDYIYGRELTEEEIAAQKALEPKYLPEMEVFELPEVNKKRKIFLDGTSGVTLEASYDAREEGILNPVRNQNPWGTCWSFASLGIMESALIKEGEVAQNEIDLSERHLAYFVGHTGYDVLGNASGDTITSSPEDYYLEKGGNFYYAAMKLMNWQGGAAEADYPYINAYSVPDLATETAQNDIAHIENCFWLRTSANDADTIQAVKTMIKQYGVVAWSYYHDNIYRNYSTSAYYNYVNTKTNHAIMVVGWDDNYKKENFGNASNPETQPTKDGAWIVRNSWGSTWGDGGYFYISYEDLSLGSGNGAAVMTANLADDYDNNYFYGNTASYDYNGYYYQAAQVYQIKGLNTEKEKVSAVSFMIAGAETEYSIQLYKNPELEDGVVVNPGSGTAMLDTPVTGTTSYAGLYTVKLPTPVTFSTDDYVAVVITFPNRDGLMYTDQSEGAGSDWEQVNETAPGQSFYSYSTGSWVDMHNLSTPRSFRINMLTENVEETATVPVISNIDATEPVGFDSSLFYNIRWARCSNAVGYEIYRAETENGTYIKVGETGAGVRTYKDAIGKANWQKDYYYKVRALFENDVFTESEPVLAESEGILRTVLNSVVNTGDQITIKWKAVSGAEGYRIERKEQSETSFIQIADVTDADSTSYVDDISALAMGYYEYRVQAYTATETAEWSEKMTVAKGLSLSITPLTYNTAKFEWPAIEGADRYKIYIQNGDATHSYTTIFSIYVSNATQGAPCEYVLNLSRASNFKTGDTQTSYIEAVDTAGNVLSASGKITFHTKPNPLTVSASNVNRKITFSWTGGEGSSAVYIYRSMDEENPGDEPYAVITDTGVCEFEDSEFAEYGVYYYWLYPGVTNFTNEIIYGDGYSYQATIAMDPVVVTSITALNEGALKIVWGSEEEADSYSVYRCTEETGTYQLLAEHVAVSEYVDDTVITGKTYYYKITRHKGGKSSALSETIPKKGQTVPDKPVLAEATYKSITVENNFNYEYAIQTSSSVTAGTAFRSESDASLMFDNLTPATDYYIFVRTKESVTGEESVYGESLQARTAEYPFSSQIKFYAVDYASQIEAFTIDENSSMELNIRNQYGEVLDKQYFSFTSADPSVCTVDENGVVIPNPSFTGTRDKKVKITAEAIGDPLKRKVTFYVTILTKKQVASVEIDKITDGTAEKVEETVGQKFVKGTTLTFRAKAFDSSNAQMDNPALNWSISDSSIASLKVNNDKTVTVTLKKAGRVNLTCKAKDSWQKETSIQIAAYSTEPVISTTQVTVNKKASEKASNRISDAFTVQAKNGATASTPVITEVKTGRTILTPETGLNKFSVVTNSDGSYSIAMESSFLETVKNNTVYSVALHTDIGGIPEISENGTIPESFTMKVKILSKEPAVTVKVTDINRIYVQEEDLRGCLVLKAPDTVTSIRVLSAAEGQVNNFDNYFEAVEGATGQWYLQFDDSTGKYNKRSISGKLEITVNGYEPVIKSVTVKTPSSLPVVKQQQVPTIQTKTSSLATISLYNSTKKELLDHFMVQKVVSVALECPEENTVLSDGNVTLAVKDGAEVKEGATLSATLTVMEVNAEGENCWQKPLNVKVQVKVYKDKAPSIFMKPDSFTLNKQTPGEKAKTVLSLSCENVPVSEDSTWQLYAYNSKTRKYDLQGAGYTDWLTVTYEESSKEVSVGFVEEKSSQIKDATYKFKISHVAEGYEEVYKEITVKVINKQPAITVKTSGKLDLVKRADCTLSGKLTLQNIPSGVSEVIVQNEDRTGANPYYRAELAADGKTFKISMTEAGLETPMTTAKVVLPLEIQLENGQKVQMTMSFKPVQSTPVIKVPTAKTLYKSLPGLSVDYDLTSGQTAGTKIKKIDTVDVSEGIRVTETEENGHLKVELSNRGIKSGTYKIKVNIYFEGAQVFTGYPDGKPLTRTITVKVAE